MGKKNGNGRGSNGGGENGFKRNGHCNGYSRDGQRSSVIPIRPLRDDEGHQYLAICSYYKHFGLIANEAVCLSRECGHYNMLFLRSGENIRPYSKEKNLEDRSLSETG